MKTSVKRFFLSLASSAVTGFVGISSALASNIGGIPAVPGAGPADLRGAIINVLNTVVNFLGLLMVIAIVVAGFRLVLSQGEEEGKEKAKKGVFYAIIGLILVLLAKAIILFVTTAVN